jgi:hypothetical protein
MPCPDAAIVPATRPAAAIVPNKLFLITFSFGDLMLHFSFDPHAADRGSTSNNLPPRGAFPLHLLGSVASYVEQMKLPPMDG